MDIQSNHAILKTMNIANKQKIALVLSGGGIKAAAFHIGVCLALREKGFKFLGGNAESVRQNDTNDPRTIRLYVGSSAGAFISSILAAGYSLEALVSAFEMGAGLKYKTYKVDDVSRLRPLTYRDIFALNSSSLTKFIPSFFQRSSLVSGGIETFIKNGFKLNGLFSTKGLEKYLRKHVLPENDFSKLGVELYIIGTQLNHTRKVIFGNFKGTSKTDSIKYAHFASISQAVAASAALPPVYAPYGIVKEPGKEMFFFDGEIRDTLSTHVASDNGADLVISSYSIQPYHFNPQMGSLHNYGIPVIINQALYQVVEQKIKRHIESRTKIKLIYNDIDKFCLENKIPEDQRDTILNIVKSRADYKPEVDYLYINPSPKNHEMFFVDHFSLNPEILSRIVNIGFKSALNTLRKIR